MLIRYKQGGGKRFESSLTRVEPYKVLERKNYSNINLAYNTRHTSSVGVIKRAKKTVFRLVAVQFLSG